MTTVARLQNLTAVKRIDRGSYGIVYRADDRAALKASSNSAGDTSVLGGGDVSLVDDERVPAETGDATLGRAELVEAMILRRAAALNAPHIVRLDALCFDSFINGRQHALVLQLQLAQCSLTAFANEHPDRLGDASIRRKILRDTVQAVHFLHTQLGAVHVDIKPGNILVNTAGDFLLPADDIDPALADASYLPYCRLADFGMSTMPALAVHGHGAAAYTFAYRPPELFDDLRAPTLLRATTDAAAALRNESCFAGPVRGDAAMAPKPLRSAAHIFTTPPATTQHSAAVGKATPSLYCVDETLAPSPAGAVAEHCCSSEAANAAAKRLAVPQPVLPSPLRWPAPQRSPAPLVQANPARHENVTRALFASDVWALGSVALFLATLGQHPVERLFQWYVKAKFTETDNASLQPDHRVQLCAWHKLVAEQQKPPGGADLYAFDSILQHFQTAVLPRSVGPAPPTLQTLDQVLDQAHAGAGDDEYDLIVDCLQFDPRARPTAQQLLAYEFFTVARGDDDDKDGGATAGGARKRLRSSSRLAAKRVPSHSSLGFALHMQRTLKPTPALAVPASVYAETVQLLWKMCERFRFSYKTALLAVIYMQQSVATWCAALSCNEWTTAERSVHVAVCVLVAALVYEPRHLFDSERLVDAFGAECGFASGDVADWQRALCEALDFHFDFPSLAVFIDESLVATGTMRDFASSDRSSPHSATLLGQVTRLALHSYTHLSASESVMTALALLQRNNFTAAFQHLLLASGQKRAAVDATRRLIDAILDH